MESLKNCFTNVLQTIIGLTNNSYLTFLKGAVEMVSDSSQEDNVLYEYNKNLLEIASENNFALNADKTNEFAQLLGEAQFYLLCKNKGIILNRIKAGTAKTPDFRFEAQDMCFEVKTLSVVSGSSGIKKSLEDSLEAQIDIEDELKKGKRIATGISVVQPYGERPYKKGKGTITAIIETLIEKTCQNLKRDQFPNTSSFLVLNLSIIPPFRTDNYVLRPAYCDDYLFKKAVTGDLWMVAFGKSGMLIHGIPEFEGEAGIEGLLEKSGILSDPQYNYVTGILLMIHPWHRPTEVWGLFDSQVHAQWNDSNPEIAKCLFILTGDNWNDDMDSNGWNLQGALQSNG
ncbi:MAG: hypothetical protein GX147_02570 [Deltaproteobacteria bacterium]|nr:hypothetical protein [Deltaproteobacteria bacterium]